MVAEQLRSGRKTATIRLGDKSAKYKKGMVVRVLVGARYGPREKVFDAVIDNPGIQLIMGLHEGIVIAMADGYHKVSGKPAFVNVHVIAGTAQMAGQLYNASRDGSALVITAGL